MAGFVTQADAALYTAFSPDAAEKEALIRQWLEKADVPSNVHPSENSRFVTLSTCSYEYDNARYVLIGILKQCQGDV
jgi:sortase B